MPAFANTSTLGAMLYLPIKNIEKMATILGFLIMASSLLFAQPIVPSGFVQTPDSTIGTSSWFELNHWRNEFAVENKNGKLLVHKRNAHQSTSEFRMLNGKLVGLDNGEWGGVLKFIPANRKLAEVAIKEGNIKYIFQFEGNIYFLEGITHGTVNRGDLFKLDTNDKKFTYNKVVEFEDAPEAFTVFGDNILIASHRNFFVLQRFEKTVIVKGTFWRGLYPNSVAAFDEQNVFIGMRGGIAKLNLVTKDLTFYQYQK